MIIRKKDIIKDKRYSRILYLDSGTSSLNKTMLFDEDGNPSVYDKLYTKKNKLNTFGGETPNILLFYK